MKNLSSRLVGSRNQSGNSPAGTQSNAGIGVGEKDDETVDQHLHAGRNELRQKCEDAADAPDGAFANTRILVLCQVPDERHDRFHFVLVCVEPAFGDAAQGNGP